MNIFSQEKNFIDLPYLETSAKCDTLVTPDRIFLKIVISEKDTKGKISVEELETRSYESIMQELQDYFQKITPKYPEKWNPKIF